MNKRKIKMSILVIFIFIILGIISYKSIEKSFENNRKTSFHKCISIGNALEAPKGTPLDVTMKAEYFDIIKNAGFDSVRLPVRFSDYVDKETYIFDGEFINKIDYYVDYALQDNLSIILDFHNFEEIMAEPEKYNEMFISIWNQLSERYKDYPDNLIFELLNEPKDRNLILTFHYYEPYKFTFQGDQYHKEYSKLKDIKWTGTEKEIEILNNKFDIAKKYSKENNIPVFLGEFGVNKTVQDSYRWQWIKAVRSEADSYNFSWAYWEFCSNFGIYDLESQTWGTELRALMPY